MKIYIDPVDGMGEGKAPIGAHVTIDTITPIPVSIKVKLVLEKGYEIQEVLKRLEDNINSYFSDKSLIKYVLVGATITQTEG